MDKIDWKVGVIILNSVYLKNFTSVWIEENREDKVRINSQQIFVINFLKGNFVDSIRKIKIDVVLVNILVYKVQNMDKRVSVVKNNKLPEIYLIGIVDSKVDI